MFLLELRSEWTLLCTQYYTFHGKEQSSELTRRLPDPLEKRTIVPFHRSSRKIPTSTTAVYHRLAFISTSHRQLSPVQTGVVAVSPRRARHLCRLVSNAHRCAGRHQVALQFTVPSPFSNTEMHCPYQFDPSLMRVTHFHQRLYITMYLVAANTFGLSFPVA